MLQRAASSAVCTAARSAHAVATALPKAAGARFAHAWLQGKPPKVNPDAGTLAAFYYKAVRDFELPTKDCLAAPGQDEKFSHVGLDRHVYAYAVGLIDALGVKKGSKVGLWLGNEVESLVLQYAAALIGAQAVTIDPAASWDAVLRTVAEEGLRVLVVPARAGAENRGAKLAEAFAEELDYFKFEAGTEPLRSKRFRALKWLVSTGSDAPDGVVRLRDVPVYGNNGQYDFDVVAAVQAYVAPSDAISVSVGADGRRGRPVSHGDALATASAAVKALALTSGDVVTVTAPLGSHFGFAAGAMAANAVHAKTVLPGKTFDAGKTLEAMTAQRATVLVATPAQVAALSAALAEDAAKPAPKRAYDLSSLRAGLVMSESGAAGSPLSIAAASLKPVNAAKLPGAAAFSA